MFIVTGLTEGGLAALGVRGYVSGDAAAREQLMHNLLALRLVLVTLGAALALLFSLLAGWEDAMVLGTIIAAAGLLPANLAHTLGISLQGDLRLGWLAALDLLRQVATAGLVVVLVLASAGLVPFFAVSAVTGVLVLAITLPLVRGRVRLRFAADVALWRSLLRDTLVYGAASALGVVYFQIAVIAMSVLSTDRETSYYALAFRVLELVNVVPFLLATSAFPILARAADRDADRLRYALSRMFDVALVVGGLATVGFVVGAPFAVALLGGDELAPAVPVLRTMGAALVASFVIAVWAHALLSLRRHLALLVANGTALALAVVLSALLLPGGGARAGALVTVALELTLATGYLVALARTRRDLLPSAHVVPRWLAALGAALALGLLLPVPSVVATLLAAALYLLVLAVTGAVPRELLDAVRRR